MGENLAPEQLGLAGIRPFLEAAPPVRAEPEGIGAPLSRMRQRLVKCGQTLSGLVEPAGQALVSEAISRLGQQVFRIVVVGQIKSGKSSFINAFTRQPAGLLACRFERQGRCVERMQPGSTGLRRARLQPPHRAATG